MLKLQNQGGERTGSRYWIMAAALLVFLTVVLGNVTRTSGAAEACPDWPTCYGQLALPVEQIARISMLHRILSAATLVLTLTALGRVLVRKSINHWVRLPLAAATIILLVQTGLGAGMALLEATPTINALHLGLALVTMGLLLMAVMAAFRQSGETVACTRAQRCPSTGLPHSPPH